MNNSYMRFLRSVASLEPIQLKQKDLSPTARLLLNKIAVKNFEEQPLTVTQAMGFNALGSAANLHRKITELLDAGMISLEHVGTNRRTKYLMITEVARDYFQIKNDAMLKAVQSR
jgi:predicted transcriptional regulator